MAHSPVVAFAHSEKLAVVETAATQRVAVVAATTTVAVVAVVVVEFVPLRIRQRSGWGLEALGLVAVAAGTDSQGSYVAYYTYALARCKGWKL